ncbi:MAG: asparagine synthase, partial [Firmicutes bacterium]|nr:asparagine synthase [Bacillota bacterium]
MSMYCGLEARVPFADHRIVEYVYNVPWSMKYRNNVAKSLLREACRDLLPEAILMRRKSPYPKTYHPEYERLLSQRLQDILSNPNSPIIPLIDKQKLLSFLQAPAEYGKPWFGQLMAAPQLVAYYLQVNYWLEKYTHYAVDKGRVFLYDKY